MPTSVSFPVPYGPWGYDPATGAPQHQYFQDSTFFSFGPAPYTGTIANTIDGALSVPFVPLIFDDTGSIWADCQLGAANTAMSISTINNMWNI